jgi:hypothetical protein
MAYKPTKRQLMNAQKIGVMIVPSSNLRKKLDVYRNGRKISEIGATGYLDYDGYIRRNGLDYANDRRRLYMARHWRDINRKGTAGYYANKILWN